MEYIKTVINYFSKKEMPFKKPDGYKNVNTSSIIK